MQVSRVTPALALLTFTVVLSAASIAGGATGDLDYKNCITGELTVTAACEEVGSRSAGGGESGLDRTRSVAVSADGTSLYAVSTDDDAVARFTRNTTTGKLTYKGCITGEIESGPAPLGSKACTLIASAASGGANSGLDFPQSLVLSADGTSLYVTSFNDDAIARFSRDTTSGKIRYRGCVTGETESGPSGTDACDVLPSAAASGANSGLSAPIPVALSPDGASVYAGSSSDDAVVRFTRDTITGKLTYKSCITGETQSGPAGSGACDAIGSVTSSGLTSGLDSPDSIALSADGASLYVASQDDDAIAHFSRNTTSGKLGYKSCITGETQSGPDGSGACSAVGSAATSGMDSGLDSQQSVTVSADGASVYSTSFFDDAVVRFNRDTSTGALTYKGCLTAETESGPLGSEACDAVGTTPSAGTNSGLDQPQSLVLSPDGASLYAASRLDDAIAVFRRNTTSGRLNYANCTTGETETGPAGTSKCKIIVSATSDGVDSGLDEPVSLALSSDGTSLYAAAQADDAVARFARAP